MKPILVILILFLLAVTSKAFSQSSCDSMYVDTVFVDQQSLQLTVYNGSRHFIVYPFFSVSLDENPYIVLGDTLTVPSFLSVADDFNGGYTPAFYHSVSIAPPATIPFQTEFTGRLTIRDPNDSTFVCTLPFSFYYGEMITGSVEAQQEKFQLYPNPTDERVFLSLPSEVAEITITDVQGNRILSKTVTEKETSMDLQENGVFFITVITSQSISTKKLIVHRQ